MNRKSAASASGRAVSSRSAKVAKSRGRAVVSPDDNDTVQTTPPVSSASSTTNSAISTTTPTTVKGAASSRKKPGNARARKDGDDTPFVLSMPTVAVTRESPDSPPSASPIASSQVSNMAGGASTLAALSTSKAQVDTKKFYLTSEPASAEMGRRQSSTSSIGKRHLPRRGEKRKYTEEPSSDEGDDAGTPRGLPNNAKQAGKGRSAEPPLTLSLSRSSSPAALSLAGSESLHDYPHSSPQVERGLDYGTSATASANVRGRNGKSIKRVEVTPPSSTAAGKRSRRRIVESGSDGTVSPPDTAGLDDDAHVKEEIASDYRRSTSAAIMDLESIKSRSRESTPEIPLSARGHVQSLDVVNNSLLHPDARRAASKASSRNSTPGRSAADDADDIGEDDATSIGRAVSEAPSNAPSIAATALLLSGIDDDADADLQSGLDSGHMSMSADPAGPLRKKRGRPPKKKGAEIEPVTTRGRATSAIPPATVTNPASVNITLVKQSTAALKLRDRIQATLDYERQLIQDNQHPLLAKALANLEIARSMRLAELKLVNQARMKARQRTEEAQVRQKWLQWEDAKRALWMEIWKDLDSRERRLNIEVCDSELSALLCPGVQHDLPPPAYPLARMQVLGVNGTNAQVTELQRHTIIPYDQATAQHSRWSLQAEEIQSDLEMLGLRKSQAITAIDMLDPIGSSAMLPIAHEQYDDSPRDARLRVQPLRSKRKRGEDDRPYILQPQIPIQPSPTGIPPRFLSSDQVAYRPPGGPVRHQQGQSANQPIVIEDSSPAAKQAKLPSYPRDRVSRFADETRPPIHMDEVLQKGRYPQHHYGDPGHYHHSQKPSLDQLMARDMAPFAYRAGSPPLHYDQYGMPLYYAQDIPYHPGNVYGPGYSLPNEHYAYPHGLPHHPDAQAHSATSYPVHPAYQHYLADPHYRGPGSYPEVLPIAPHPGLPTSGKYSKATPTATPRKAADDTPRKGEGTAVAKVQQPGQASRPLSSGQMHLDESEPDWRSRTRDWQRDVQATH